MALEKMRANERDLLLVLDFFQEEEGVRIWGTPEHKQMERGDEIFGLKRRWWRGGG